MESSPGVPGRCPGPESGILAIISALTSERRVLDRAPSSRQAYVVYQCGPGGQAARTAAEQAVTQGATALMSWGLAGGVTPAAVTGSVIVPQSILNAGGSEIRTTADWRDRIVSLIGTAAVVLDGRLASAATAVTCVPAKQRLADELDVAAVDMESRAVGEVAAAAGLPFVVVRVIVDGGNDSLPAAAESFVDAAGDVRIFRALGSLMRSPQNIPALWRLGRQSAVAHACLARVATALAAAGYGLCTEAPT